MAYGTFEFGLPVSRVVETPRELDLSGRRFVVLLFTVRLTEDIQTLSLANWSGEGASGSGSKGSEILEGL